MKSISLLAVFILFSTLSGSLYAQTCQPPNAIPQPTYNHLRCYGTGDTVNANPSANSHYTYSWSTGATTSSIIITNPTDSAFSVTVTNTQLSCSAVFTDTVRNDPQIHNTNILHLICSSTAAGNLQLDGAGGTGILTYMVTGVGTDSTGSFPNLVAGNYTYIISDSFGCSQTGSVSIPQSSGQTFNVTVDSGTCTQNKTIVVTPVNGQGIPYEYALDGGGFSSTDSFTNVAPGAHIIITKNSLSGCIDTLSAVVHPSGSIANPTFNPAICYGITTDTVNANPGDSSGLTYSWSTGATTSYIVTSGGPFSVTVTSAQNNCTAVFKDTIRQDKQISYSNVYDLSLCSVPPYADVTMNGRGGDSIFTYYLFGVDTNTTGYFPKLPPGSYHFAIFDALGCEDTDVFSIPQGATSATFNVRVTPATCATLADGEIIVSPTTSQIGFLQYSLDGGSAQTDTTFNNVLAGNYTITISNIVTGCTYDTSATVTAPAGYTASVTPDSINEGPGSTDTISVTTTYPNPAYSWTPVTGLGCDTCATTTVVIDTTMNGKYYYVKVYTAGDSGCYSLDSVLIHSQIPVLFQMPSAFSPNGDGHDDFFGPASVMNSFTSPTVKALRIYDRYGQLVFNSSAPDAKWDGKFKGKDQPVGTYVYYIQVQYTDPDTGKPVNAKQEGSVTLLR